MAWGASLVEIVSRMKPPLQLTQMGATGSNRRESRIILTRRRRCGRFPKNHHHGRAKTVQGARHNGTHKKEFEERRWHEEMAVGLGLSQKAHGFGLQIHRFAERAERVRILRTIVRRINVVGGNGGLSPVPR